VAEKSDPEISFFKRDVPQALKPQARGERILDFLPDEAPSDDTEACPPPHFFEIPDPEDDLIPRARNSGSQKRLDLEAPKAEKPSAAPLPVDPEELLDTNAYEPWRATPLVVQEALPKTPPPLPWQRLFDPSELSEMINIPEISDEEAGLPRPVHLGKPGKLSNLDERQEPSVILNMPALTGQFEFKQVEPKRGRLTVRGGALAGKSWYLNRQRTHLGRGTDNDIVLLDVSVSRQHLRFERHVAGFTLFNLSDGNGTRLNNRRIQQSELYDGDLLQIGKLNLEFSSQGEARLRDQDLQGTDPGPQTFNPQASKRFPFVWLLIWSLTTFLVVFSSMYLARRLLREPGPIYSAAEEASQYHRRGLSALEKKHWRQAREDFLVARKLSPERFPCQEELLRADQEMSNEHSIRRARLRLGRATLEEIEDLLGQVQAGSVYAVEMRKLRERAQDLDLKHRLEAADEALSSGFTELARSRARQILEEDPSNGRAQSILEAAQADEQEVEGKINRQDVERARREMSRGRQFYQQERFADAVVLLERAARRAIPRKLRTQARNRARWTQAFSKAKIQGEAASAAKKPRESALAFEQALELDRKLGGHYRDIIRAFLVEQLYYHARWAFAQNRYGEAAVYVRRTLSFDPEHPLAEALRLKVQSRARQLLVLAKAAQEGDPARARQLSEEAVSMSAEGSVLYLEAIALMEELSR